MVLITHKPLKQMLSSFYDRERRHGVKSQMAQDEQNSNSNNKDTEYLFRKLKPPASNDPGQQSPSGLPMGP